jgi:hypothetical protein
MAEWPDHPTPGDSVRLPLALAPMLLEALGYAAGWTTQASSSNAAPRRLTSTPGFAARVPHT